MKEEKKSKPINEINTMNLVKIFCDKNRRDRKGRNVPATIHSGLAKKSLLCCVETSMVSFTRTRVSPGVNGPWQ